MLTLERAHDRDPGRLVAMDAADHEYPRACSCDMHDRDRALLHRKADDKCDG
jgi:hypothetical protein